MELQHAPKSVFGRVRLIIGGSWKTVACILVLTLVIAGLSSLEPLVQKYIIDALTGVVVEPRDPAASFFEVITANQQTWIYLLLLVGLILAHEALGFISNYVSWRLRLYTNYSLLDAIASRLYNLSLRFHQAHTVAEIRTRMDKAINGFCEALFNTFAVLPSVFFLVCTLVLMFKLSFELSIVALVFAPIPAIIGYFSGRIISRREKLLTEKWSAVFSRFDETLQLVKQVKSFAQEDRERQRFLSEVHGANEVVRKGVLVDSFLGGGKNLSMAFARVAVLAVGTYLILRGGSDVTIGTIVAFLSFTGGLSGPVLGLTGIWESCAKGRMYLGMMFDLIQSNDKLEDKPGAVDLQDVRGEVTFENVSFGYTPEKTILSDVTFTVPAGAFVAIVGESGSGKSTTVDLINRFWEPQFGRVLIDGTDVRDVTQSSLRRNIGMVLQNTTLFNDTIRSNIAFANPAATDEQVHRAAEAANALKFIHAHKDGFDRVVGRGGEQLSGGERQRIAIARAILKDSKILIFDEASSNLDAESEHVVQEAVERLREGRTMFVIAHRLATIKNADMILVMERGRIVEQGTHNELIQRGGKYANLVALQSLTPARA